MGKVIIGVNLQFTAKSFKPFNTSFIVQSLFNRNVLIELYWDGLKLTKNAQTILFSHFQHH